MNSNYKRLLGLIFFVLWAAIFSQLRASGRAGLFQIVKLGSRAFQIGLRVKVRAFKNNKTPASKDIQVHRRFGQGKVYFSVFYEFFKLECLTISKFANFLSQLLLFSLKQICQILQFAFFRALLEKRVGSDFFEIEFSGFGSSRAFQKLLGSGRALGLF